MMQFVSVKKETTESHMFVCITYLLMFKLRCVVTLGKVMRCFGSQNEKLEVASKIVNLLKKFVLTQEYSSAFNFRSAKMLIEELAS